MLLVVKTVAAEEVDVSMEEVMSEDMEEEVYEVEEDTSKEVVEGEEVHMKMELTSQISPVTLNINSGLYFQTTQGKVSLGTRYAQSSWQVKRSAPPSPSVMKRITRIG